MKSLLALALCAAFPLIGRAQGNPLAWKQVRDGDDVRVLSRAEFATLGDPLFQRLLKENATATGLNEILDKLQPDAGKRRLFAVSERIVSENQPNASRRGVVAFKGILDGEPLEGNVMLSVTFLPNGTVLSDIEGWGWDNLRGRYNYYKLDGVGAPPGRLTWKFRGTSENADLLTANERLGTCLQCHTTGAPVMKELAFPWNNWHSLAGGAFRANYIDPTIMQPAKWPAAATPLFRQLGGAEELEKDQIIPALKRFNESRINALLVREDATGNRRLENRKLTLTSANRLLRSLFEPTEVNLLSSRDRSGIHPFGGPNEFIAAKPIRLPDDFFLHTSLIVGGVQLPSARKFASFASITQAENKAMVEKFRLRFNGVSGDANFAWFVPVPSFVDTEMAERLVKFGVVPPHFLAAVQAIDLEEPLFSAKRASLIKYLPERLEFTPLEPGTDPTTIPRDPNNDPLTKAVIARINQDNPAPGSPGHQFRALLSEADPVKALDDRVKEYATRVEKALGQMATRPAEVERLFGILVARRQAMVAHPLFSPLDETRGRLLLPLPSEQ